MPIPRECFVCKLRDQQSEPALGDRAEVVCDCCGSYEITGSAMAEIGSVPEVERPLISEWVRSQNRLGSRPLITTHNLPILRGLPRLEFMERARRLLLYMAEKTGMLGTQVDVLAPELRAMLQTAHR